MFFKSFRRSFLSNIFIMLFSRMEDVTMIKQLMFATLYKSILQNAIKYLLSSLLFNIPTF